MARWQKGKPPGPGRPPGCRNKSTLWLEAIAAEGVEKVVRVVQQEAEGGNMRAASLMLSRIWPHQRGRTLELDLPTVETAGGVVQAQAAVIAAMAKGELTPAEAAAVAALLENQRRAIETHVHERRIDDLMARDAGEGSP